MLSPSWSLNLQAALHDTWLDVWTEALLLPGEQSLFESLVKELSLFYHLPLDEARRRCHAGQDLAAAQWRSQPRDSEEDVRRFYRDSTAYAFDLMRWHSIAYSAVPLGNVWARALAVKYGCRRCLDFGGGVGSTGILLARRGLDVTLADISDSLLDFAKWRFGARGLSGTLLDLTQASLPRSCFDLALAIDVLEHAHEPRRVLQQLLDSLAPSALLVVRAPFEARADHPMHIGADPGVWAVAEAAGFRALPPLGFAGFEAYRRG